MLSVSTVPAYRMKGTCLQDQGYPDSGGKSPIRRKLGLIIWLESNSGPFGIHQQCFVP